MSFIRRPRLLFLIVGLIALTNLMVGTFTFRGTKGPLLEKIQEQSHERAASLADLLARAVAPAMAFGADAEELKGDMDSVFKEKGVAFVYLENTEQEQVYRLVNESFDGRWFSLVTKARDKEVYSSDDDPTKPVVVQVRKVKLATPAASGGLDDFMFEAAPAATQGPPAVHGTVYVGLDKSDMLHKTEEASKTAVRWALIVSILCILVAGLVTSIAVRPLTAMVRAAKGMAAGDYSRVEAAKQRFMVKEVSELADVFVVMRDSLVEVADQAKSISEGDLSRRVDGAGQLGEAFNAMVHSLGNLVGQIQNASIQLASSSAEILAASKQAERGSSEQASSINQTTTTMDELLSASKQIASSADSVVQIAERTLSAAKNGEEAVGESITGMKEIATNNRQTAERILELSERNQRIGAIVELIDEIADKSDLLALNAAIEGAKAGEAGRGFAVVATEMRALAENVVESTKEIKSLISDIQKASNASVLATEGQMKATERGQGIAERTADHLQQIVLMVEQTTEAAKQISLSTQQQRTGTEQVVQSTGEIAKIAKSNVAGASQTTSSTVELAKLADELRETVSQFQLGASEK